MDSGLSPASKTGAGRAQGPPAITTPNIEPSPKFSPKNFALPFLGDTV
jgi:hypothetical protein